MRILYTFFLFVASSLSCFTFSQEVSTRRIINVTLDVSEPSHLLLNHGRLVWKSRDPGLQTFGLSYYTGAEIFRLDSNLTGFTHTLDGDYIVWNTDEEEIKIFNVRDWSTATLGPSYNPDMLQPVSIAGGRVAYAIKAGNGSSIAVKDLVSNHDTLFSEGAWNLQPSLHDGQLAWVQKFLADTSVSNIYFFDGNSTRLLTFEAASRNLRPELRDGQVIWLQITDQYNRVKFFNGDSVMTLAEAGTGFFISGYDLSDGIGVVAVTNSLTNATKIRIYNTETDNFTEINDTAQISGLHMDNGLICWSWGTGAIKNLKLFHMDTGEIEEWGVARNPVVDDEEIAWTLGDAVDMMVPITYLQLSSGNDNGWPQSRFKDHDGSKVIWGNLDNSTTARLFYSDGNSTVQLTDSLIYKDFIMLNDGYAVWRHDFTSMYLYDGSNTPELIIDSLQCENMYLADGAIGFHGFRTNAGNNINQAWLYKIDTKVLKQLSHDDSSNVTNTFTLVDGDYACWYRDSANNSMLMLYDGTRAGRLTDSTVQSEFGFRDGKIIWSEEKQGVFQIMLYDVITGLKKQITHGDHGSFRPITDGSAAVWFEAAPGGTLMWYYNIAADKAHKFTRYKPPVARLLWLSNGKVAWPSNGEVCVYDGNIISRLTNTAPYNPNSDPYVDDDVVVWNKNNPDPNTNHFGQIFRAKLHAHVAFDANHITGLAPLTVSFTNHSFQGVRSFLWDFGDGQTSTEKDPVHVYHNPGVYSVTLSVEGLTGNTTEKKINLIRVSQLTSSEENSQGHQVASKLYQNFPNPFTLSTTIPFDLSEPLYVSLQVYDLLGNEVATLADEKFPAGYHEVLLNGAQLSGGTYIVRFRAGNYTKSIILNLIR